MAKATRTYTVRLTEGNVDHEKALLIIKDWENYDHKPQAILVKAILALGGAQPSNPENALAELIPRLERAINKLNSFQGMVSASDVQSSVKDELDLNDEFLASISSHFSTTNG